MRLSVATRAKIALTTAIAIAAAYYATADPPRAFRILHRHADASRGAGDPLPRRRTRGARPSGRRRRRARCGAPSPPWQRISTSTASANQTAICSALAAAASSPRAPSCRRTRHVRRWARLRPRSRPTVPLRSSSCSSPASSRSALCSPGACGGARRPSERRRLAALPLMGCGRWQRVGRRHAVAQPRGCRRDRRAAAAAAPPWTSKRRRRRRRRRRNSGRARRGEPAAGS